jgi:diguanylate cyclase (GGDEF)-like protein
MRAERAVSASLRANRELTRADGLALLRQYPLADLRRVQQNLLVSHLNLNLLAIDLEKELDEAELFYEWILIVALIFASLVAMVSSSLVYRRTIVRPLESISIIASSVPAFDVESDATEGVSALHKAVKMLDQSTLGSTEIQSLRKAMVSLLARLITACEMLNDLSMTDPLCQIGNRRALKLYGIKIWQQAARAKCPVGVLIIDVDHFKQYNDGYGHSKGDHVLRDLAQAFSQQLKRPLDDVYRFGGEEFVILMYDLSAEKFVDLCEQIRASVESLSIDHRYVASGLITISGGGYYASNTRSMSMDSAIQAADRELYRSKKLGRNRISIDDSGIQSVQDST